MPLMLRDVTEDEKMLMRRGWGYDPRKSGEEALDFLIKEIINRTAIKLDTSDGYCKGPEMCLKEVMQEAVEAYSKIGAESYRVNLHIEYYDFDQPYMDLPESYIDGKTTRITYNARYRGAFRFHLTRYGYPGPAVFMEPTEICFRPSEPVVSRYGKEVTLEYMMHEIFRAYRKRHIGW